MRDAAKLMRVPAFWLLAAVLGSAIYTSPPRALLLGWPNIDAYFEAVWWTKWFWLMAALTGYVAVKISASRGVALGLLVGWTMLSALWAMAWPGAYATQPPMIIVATQIYAAYAFMAIVTLVVVLSTFKWREFRMSVKAFEVLCLINSAVIIAQALLHVPARARGGLFGNPSISGSLIGFTAPFVYPRMRDLWLLCRPGPWGYALLLRCLSLVLPLAAVLLTGTSQPVAVFAVAMAAKIAAEYIWMRTRAVATPGGVRWRVRPGAVRRMVLIVAGILVSALIAIPLTTSKHGRSAFHSSGRLEAWADVFLDGEVAVGIVNKAGETGDPKMGTVVHASDLGWLSVGPIWAGQGTGTTPVIVPRIQQSRERARHQAYEKKFTFAEFRWFHSDWLQILFENGIIGLALALLCAGDALRRAWSISSHLFGAIAGFAASMLFNFPLHMPTHAFIGAVLLACAYYRRRPITAKVKP